MSDREKGGPPPHPLNEGRRAFHGCLSGLGGALVTVLAFAALGYWGGTAGRMIVGAIGYGIAGFVFPWVAGSEPRTDNQTRFMIWFSVLTGIGGVALGIWMGATKRDMPWWVYATTSAAAAIAGFWFAMRWHRRRGGSNGNAIP